MHYAKKCIQDKLILLILVAVPGMYSMYQVQIWYKLVCIWYVPKRYHIHIM